MPNPPPATALNEDFADMLEALSSAQVEFLVVGAHALAARGCSVTDHRASTPPNPGTNRLVEESVMLWRSHALEQRAP
jgi:hypothetical protein